MGFSLDLPWILRLLKDLEAVECRTLEKGAPQPVVRFKSIAKML